MEAQEIANRIINCFIKAGKLIIFGNGGSATQASHFAAEFICKYKKVRRPLPAIALSDLACLTAIANDYGWEHIFSRQISVLAKKGDIVIGLSTSGSSENVLNGLKKAYDMGIETLDFPRLGETTGEIQNYQVKLMHEVCEIVEDHLYFKSYRNDN